MEFSSQAKNLDPNKNSGVGLSVGLVALDLETTSAESSQSSDSEFKRGTSLLLRFFGAVLTSNTLT